MVSESALNCSSILPMPFGTLLMLRVTYSLSKSERASAINLVTVPKCGILSPLSWPKRD
jgi:hypothetical protein